MGIEVETRVVLSCDHGDCVNTVTIDGTRNRRTATNAARQQGWQVGKDSGATCPTCPHRLSGSVLFCPQGHPYEGDNLYLRPRGYKECRICRREKHRIGGETAKNPK